ncbi:DUF6816 family protein [Leptolyngbya sp. FACHB-261]|uniref:DUF6816 family protein n=1 Tax=Leptolyngbya sp. FACHB-261 TaxID=2692806 RepID=UPI0018F01ABB|nr:hypothetical protein [Leptolyngbya sp. FACHB-261]
MSLWCWSLLLWVLLCVPMQAGPLAERMAQFPDWGSPRTQRAQGDLIYPDWFQGTWQVSTKLVDLVAPLAPEITTPGFEGNRSLLNQPVHFQARFNGKPGRIVADRTFNGRNLAKAYLGNAVQNVKADPADPNRQVTLLRGNRQLVSIVTQRATETPSPERYITSEVFEQVFRGAGSVRFNRVETTTDYIQQIEPNGEPLLNADQITAVYLSPQDPDYFKAANRPVALYRYHLCFESDSKSAELL